MKSHHICTLKDIFFHSNRKDIFLFFIYSLFLLFFCSEFSPLYQFNGSPDVNIYYIIGKGILFDRVPYRDLFDHKGPLIFFIYALGYTLSADSFLGMYIVSSLFLFIAITFVYFLSKLFINRYLSIISALSFPIFLMIFIAYGGTAEEYILTFLVISLFLFIYYFQTSAILHNPKVMFIHGVMFSSVFFIKLNLVVFWFFPTIFIFIFLLIKRYYKNLFTNLFSFTLGCSFITIPILLYFLFNDAFPDFWEAYIYVNYKYGGVEIVNYWYFFCGLLLRFLANLQANYINFSILIFGVFCFSFLSFIKKKHFKYSILLSFLFISIILYSPGVAMSYYYIIFTVFYPLGIISILYFFENKFTVKNSLLKPVVLVSIFVCSFICISKQNLFGYSISNLTSRDFPDSTPTLISDKVSSIKNPTLLCVGLNAGLDVFYLSNILPNIKYFFTPNISYEDYPQILEGQLSNINNQDIDFVILMDNYRYVTLYDSVLVESGYEVKYQVSDYLLYQVKK